MNFYSVAAEAMRRILVESAPRRKRLKHGGQLERVDLIYVSTTARSLEEVSTHFSDNIGSDNTLVFDGTSLRRSFMISALPCI